mgnify:CR=1 FL=1
MNLTERFEHVKQVIKGRYFFFFILFSSLYLIFTAVINKFYAYVPTLQYMDKFVLIPMIILNVIIAVLFGITLNLIVFRYKEAQKFRKEAGLAPLGVFAGLLGGLCPGCFAGLFPSIVAIFGVSISLSSLPLFGAEFLIIAIIIMLVAIYFLTNTQVACKVKSKKKK